MFKLHRSRHVSLKRSRAENRADNTRQYPSDSTAVGVLCDYEDYRGAAMTTNTAKQMSNNAQKVLDELRELDSRLDELGFAQCSDARIRLHEAVALIEPMAKGEAVGLVVDGVLVKSSLPQGFTGELYTRPQPAEALAAVRTLEFLGYTYHGGEQWKPPLGNKPAESGVSEAEFDLDRWINLNGRSAGTYWDATTHVVAVSAVRELLKGKRLAPESREVCPRCKGAKGNRIADVFFKICLTCKGTGQAALAKGEGNEN